MKKWEGVILSVSDGVLTVELTPYDYSGPVLVADFDVDLLGTDSASAAPGNIVHFTSATVGDAAGNRNRTSSLKLQRPRPWDSDELREIENIAKNRATFLGRTST